MQRMVKIKNKFGMFNILQVRRGLRKILNDKYRPFLNEIQSDLECRIRAQRTKSRTMKKTHTKQDWILINNLAIYTELNFRISMEG